MFKKLQEDFKKLVASERLSHAYLFFGDSDKNQEKKFIFAQSLANFLENGIFEPPAKLLQETLIILPDEKGTIGIDAIRSLKHFLWQKPNSAKRRTAIIQEAENLTTEAQNAALKIVEEPPESALIIFIINHEDNLFPALSSRLQKIYFSYNSDKQKFEKSSKGDSFNIDKILEKEEIDQFFESLILDLRKEPIENSRQLKEILNRLVLMKQFNTNKRLQLKALISNF